MESGSTRVMAALGCLAIVWIAMYWLYEPGGRDSQGLAPLPQMADTPLPAARSGPAERPRTGEAAPNKPLTTGTDPAAGRPTGGEASKPTPPTPPTPTSPTSPTSTPTTSTPGASGVIPPQFEDYTVKAGETFETIARTRYGSSKLATAIMHANPMKDPKRLKPGDQIRLPKDPTNIQGKAAPAEAGPGKAGPAAGGPGEASTEYVVQAGDTLTGIAKALWGSSKGWRRILEANQGVLPSEDRLKAGMKLRIPPKPAD